MSKKEKTKKKQVITAKIITKGLIFSIMETIRPFIYQYTFIIYLSFFNFYWCNLDLIKLDTSLSMKILNLEFDTSPST
jgi:hypothetical protein